MYPNLHPWLSTDEALRAATQAVTKSMNKLPGRGQMIGKDELLSEALSILTECALPPRDEPQPICAECGRKMPEDRRRNAKYCSPQCTSKAGVKRHRMRGKGFDVAPPPQPPKTHIGSMWQWPEESRFAYAVQEVAFRLCHYISTGHLETPASQTLYNLAVADVVDEDALGIVHAWLEANGVLATGDESTEDLLEAISNLKSFEAETMKEVA